ncbi:hypothetical protein FQA47_010473 [Oryzias melastigma]|uniref:Uncharacterized protein n=1 Tax=Oryzias melastigma TaxID=30732 RepID=A0A834BYB7_ORYME|nr:hypothetical protein FQA47_010473 [Oryzias melastigma]
MVLSVEALPVLPRTFGQPQQQLMDTAQRRDLRRHCAYTNHTERAGPSFTAVVERVAAAR